MNIQQTMNEKNIDIQYNNINQEALTERKQQNNKFVDSDDIKENKTRIFKYPYLIEKSTQKFKQDNKSNNSTQKPAPRTHHRKKIFQPMPKIFTQMKKSTHSADIQRIVYNSFQSNPIQSKIKQSKSKQRRKNSYNIVNQVLSNTSPSFTTAQPVVFNYINPSSQLYHPSVTYYQNPVIPPRLYTQASNNPTNYVYQRRIIRSPPKITQYVIPNHQPIKTPQIMRNSSILNPSIGYPLQRYQNYKNQIQKIKIPYNQTIFRQIQQRSPQIKHNYINIKKKSMTGQQYDYQVIPPKSYCSIINNEQMDYRKTATLQNNIKLKKAESTESAKTFLTSQQHLNAPNLYETYKPVIKFSNKQHQIIIPSNKNIIKKQKIQKKDIKNASISSFSEVLCGNSSEHSIVKYAQQIAQSIEEQPNYSDRFDDMEIKDNKNKKAERFQSFIPSKNQKMEKYQSIKNNNSVKQVKQQDKKQHLSKKGSISSVMYQNEKKLKQMQSSHEQKYTNFLQKHYNKLQQFSRLNQQGRLMTLVLIGISILLVIFQILK